MPTILVTGGAGYIGSHTLRALKTAGFDPVCMDNLSTGFREFAADFPFILGDLANPQDLETAFSSYPIQAVVHFASHALVEESYRNPFKYYRDNLLNSLNLLEAMRAHAVRYIVFSSSCATYGAPERIPIEESTPLNPVNPYGMTKMVIERMLADYGHAHGLSSVALRYFNAAGAAREGGIGEWHNPETHLIPRLLAAALARAEKAEIFGNDYPTRDGTCIRDYVHVTDLAEAHVAALQYLFRGHPSTVLNLGTGQGYSVVEVVEQVRRATRSDMRVEFKPRRMGDPPQLVADPAKARAVLGWSARCSSLEEIVETAWSWYKIRCRNGSAQR